MDSGGAASWTSTKTYIDTKWHRLVVDSQAGNTLVYIDGERVTDWNHVIPQAKYNIFGGQIVANLGNGDKNSQASVSQGFSGTIRNALIYHELIGDGSGYNNPDGTGHIAIAVNRDTGRGFAGPIKSSESSDGKSWRKAPLRGVVNNQWKQLSGN